MCRSITSARLTDLKCCAIKNTFNEIENGEIDERKYADWTNIDLSRINNEILKPWVLGALKMRKRIKKHKKIDMRRFCLRQNYEIRMCLQLRVCINTYILHLNFSFIQIKT